MTCLTKKITTSFGIPCIIICCFATIKVLRQPLTPKLNRSKIPNQIALSDWTQVQTKPIAPKKNEASYNRLLESHSFRFIRGSHQLSLQLGYFLNTNGDVVTLQQHLTPKNTTSEKATVPIKWVNLSHKDFGDYLVGQSQKKEDVLLTCINPKGLNTTSQEGFTHNRLRNDLNVSHFIQWFLGRSQILDKRCLLGRLSLQNESSRENTAQDLQAIWLEIQPQLQGVL